MHIQQEPSQQHHSSKPHPPSSSASSSTTGGRKLLSRNYFDATTGDIILLVSSMLQELVNLNDALPLDTSKLTRFHSRSPPASLSRTILFASPSSAPSKSPFYWQSSTTLTCYALPTRFSTSTASYRAPFSHHCRDGRVQRPMRYILHQYSLRQGVAVYPKLSSTRSRSSS